MSEWLQAIAIALALALAGFMVGWWSHVSWSRRVERRKRRAAE